MQQFDVPSDEMTVAKTIAALEIYRDQPGRIHLVLIRRVVGLLSLLSSAGVRVNGLNKDVLWWKQWSAAGTGDSVLSG